MCNQSDAQDLAVENTRSKDMNKYNRGVGEETIEFQNVFS